MKIESSAAHLLHRMLRAVVLIGFALLILHLKRTGELALFVTPRIEQAVKLSALALLAAGAYQAFSFLRMWPQRAEKMDAGCACGHDHHDEHDHTHNLHVHHDHNHHHSHDHSHHHDHDHNPSPARSILLYGLFFLLLTVGFFMPHKPLDSDLNGKLGTTVHSHVKGEQ
ncbi:hypothetical protein PCCS19_29100 [Paenibacillus sp. CCS19]|uniref:DUF1980 domain-containing protein n=1 Tax=Paenibacillus sp. CCS19 TaxID=3158387 RepID=UPI00255F7B0E|nr:DUF1980 domain-containing protein [Paenibacillus cellulosilyticus]GMK39855.1 hypothetical protein PCCS19_29100 [Paenibacillus cellulosilyticus]